MTNSMQANTTNNPMNTQFRVGRPPLDVRFKESALVVSVETLGTRKRIARIVRGAHLLRRVNKVGQQEVLDRPAFGIEFQAGVRVPDGIYVAVPNNDAWDGVIVDVESRARALDLLTNPDAHTQALAKWVKDQCRFSKLRLDARAAAASPEGATALQARKPWWSHEAYLERQAKRLAPEGGAAVEAPSVTAVETQPEATLPVVAEQDESLPSLGSAKRREREAAATVAPMEMNPGAWTEEEMEAIRQEEAMRQQQRGA